jgi:hypothetical protein
VIDYLARLKTLTGQKHVAAEPTKLTKGASVSFVSARGEHLSEGQALPVAASGTLDFALDIEDRAAIAEHDGGLPPNYKLALAELQAACPAGVDEQRWRQAIDDADCFLENWGAHAARLGWTPARLFGLHPTAPLRRYDLMGLVWLLHGRPVFELTAARAAIKTPSGGLTFYPNRAGNETRRRFVTQVLSSAASPWRLVPARPGGG